MNGYEKRRLSQAALGKVADRFKVLSEPMRLKLLYALMVEETGGLQANVSKHLGMLLDAGVVERRKQGLNT